MLLPDDVLIQEVLDRLGFLQGQLQGKLAGVLFGLFQYDPVGLLNTTITDMGIQSCNEEVGLGFSPSTEGAF